MARMTTRQKQSRKASRNKAQKKFWRTLKLYTLSIMTVVMVGGAAAGSWWLVDSGWVEKTLAEANQAWQQALADSGFGLERMYIQGREKTKQEQVLAAIGLKIGESIFSVPLEEIQQRLEKLSTVRKATVERVLPGTLFVTLEERTPVAVWQSGGKLQLVDIDGVVLKEDVHNYPNLLMVVGKGAPQKLAGLVDLLAGEPELATHVTAAIWVGQRRWNLRFDGGVEVMLPDTEEEKAFSKLAGLQRSQQILKKSVSAIDMRLGERIFITLPEEDNVHPLTLPKEGASET